jgi:hypothetical protein
MYRNGNGNGNGNGSNGSRAAPAIPSNVLFGRSIAHRRLTARQRACLAADWADGNLTLLPSLQQAARLLRVSGAYAQRARKLSPPARAAIAGGRDSGSGSFTTLTLAAPKKRLALPFNGNRSISDGELESLAREVGADRLLAAAIAVERHS